MSRNDSPISVNFRDVGAALLRLSGRTWMPPGKLLRSGRLTAVTAPAALGSPGLVVCLREQADKKGAPAPRYAHCPFPDRDGTYDTASRDTRRWLRQVAAAVAREPGLMLIHCTAGKDRTGVAVAALLLAGGVPVELLTREYLLSDGVSGPLNVMAAVAGVGDPTMYFGAELSAAVRTWIKR